MIEDLKAGTFGTKGYSIGLADDSVQLLKTPHIPEDIWTAVMKTRDEIVGGSLKVEPVWDAEKVRGLMTSTTINEE
jgi:basic membrane protein A and related proteins